MKIMFYRFPIDQQLSNPKLADGATEDGAIGYANGQVNLVANKGK